jgi:hypothetical protein
VDDLVVPSELCRNAIGDADAVVDPAEWLIRHMSEHIGVDDFGALEVLDFGCGGAVHASVPEPRCSDHTLCRRRCLPTSHRLPAVECLRFALRVLPPRRANDLYNPTGTPLADMTVPEIDGRRFDLICLFSVFTHLSPADYVAMLRLFATLHRTRRMTSLHTLHQ